MPPLCCNPYNNILFPDRTCWCTSRRCKCSRINKEIQIKSENNIKCLQKRNKSSRNVVIFVHYTSTALAHIFTFIVPLPLRQVDGSRKPSVKLLLLPNAVPQPTDWHLYVLASASHSALRPQSSGTPRCPRPRLEHSQKTVMGPAPMDRNPEIHIRPQLGKRCLLKLEPETGLDHAPVSCF
jgi:hypothetical protein